jgi:hypothetical protein
MDPDDHKPAGAIVPESIGRRKYTALETKRVISELLLRVKDHANLSPFQCRVLTAATILIRNKLNDVLFSMCVNCGTGRSATYAEFHVRIRGIFLNSVG